MSAHSLRLALALAAVAASLPAPPARAADDARVEQLEREVSDLKLLVQDLMGAQAAARSPDHDMHMSARGEGADPPPRLVLRGFADLDYGAARVDPQDESHRYDNAFVDGDIDLFISSEISHQIDFVSEILLEFGEDGSTGVDVERMLLRWSPRDWFNSAVGRGHTALGYWNQEFHHGTWMQTTVDRPIVFRFEDDGGILPVHYVGLEASGNLETTAGLFSYVANLGNGRGNITDFVQVHGDLNDAKAIGGMVRFQPDALPGLAFGANVLFDRIPREKDVPARDGEIQERIAGLHIVYTEDPFEVLLENQFIHHRDEVSNHDFNSYGGYLQIAYRVGKWKPYYRFDWLSVADGDPFYADLEEVEDTRRHAIGFRYDWRTWVALKLEFDHINAAHFEADGAASQISFAF